MIDIVDDSNDDIKPTQRQAATIPKTFEDQSGNKGALISSLSTFKPYLLSVVNGTVGVRAVYNSDTRVFVASDTYEGKIEVRECSGNFQIKVKIGDIVDKVRSALSQKLGKEVWFYSKMHSPTHLYCFMNTHEGGDGDTRLSVLKDGVPTEMRLSELRDCYYKMTVVLRSGLIKMDSLGSKYTWSLNAYGIKLMTLTRAEIDRFGETDSQSYSHGIDFYKAL